MRQTTRESLLLRVSRGEPVAWEEFDARYRPLIAWAANRSGLTGPDVDDVIQDVMLDLFKGQGSFRYDSARGRFRDYLFVVTRRKTARVRARRGRTETGVEDYLEPAANDEFKAAWEAEWQQAILREALEVVRGEVEEKTFLAFERYELEGRPVEQVAGELEIAPASVYVYKKRVVRRLRAVVEELAER